jgi:hypothetical protein
MEVAAFTMLNESYGNENQRDVSSGVRGVVPERRVGR